MASNDGHYEVLWPRSPRQVQLQPLAKRLDTLEGKTIAQLWDYLFRGDEVFALLEEGLKERYPDIQLGELQGVRQHAWRQRTRSRRGAAADASRN